SLYLFRLQLELSVVVVNEQDAWCEAEFFCESDHFLGLVRRRGPDHAADRDAEARMPPQVEQSLAKMVQHLLGGLIAPHSIDRDLHFLQTGLVQFLDQFRAKKEAVRDHAGAEKTQLTT